jgi:hypothetical protein
MRANGAATPAVFDFDPDGTAFENIGGHHVSGVVAAPLQPCERVICKPAHGSPFPIRSR